MAENTAPMSLPNWLNGDFLEKQLQNYHTNQSLKLVNFDVKPATVKGDNYCSSMYRVTVHYTDAQSAVVKVCPTIKAIPICFLFVAALITMLKYATKSSQISK